jgi:hypothetical protein
MCADTSTIDVPCISLPCHADPSNLFRIDQRPLARSLRDASATVDKHACPNPCSGKYRRL